MKIIISPAKKMRSDLEDRHDLTQPVYLKKTARLLDYLKTLSRHELRQLLACNAALADLNYERYQSMNLEQKTSAALYSYEGIQYQYMAPQYLENHIDSYLQTHLRILSGFYGILKPFDGIVPYRLEMQAKLQTDFCRDLYDFWQDDLYREIAGGVILNLASKEYSRAIKKYIQSTDRWIDVIFAERAGNHWKEKGVYVKMARGEMVRYLAEHLVQDVEMIKQFTGLGYQFSSIDSDDEHFVFIREEKK